MTADSEFPTRDNSPAKPYTAQFARRLQQQLERYGFRLDSAVAYEVAQNLISGEEMVSQVFTLPRDVFESEYGEEKMKYARIDLLTIADEKGYVPAGPIEVKIRRYELQKRIEVPEGIDDWDTADVSLKLRVWKL